MSQATQRVSISGPAGIIECAIDNPTGTLAGVAVLCHPHPLYGGTLDNKVVHTLARAFVSMGYRALRFNFRGVGQSAGQWDKGRGEVDDALAVVAAARDPALPLVLGGFSFGGYVAAQAAASLRPPADRLVLVAPAASSFPLPPVPLDTVVVHGDADDVVPLNSTLEWARALSLPVIVLPGVGHFFHGRLSLLRSTVVNAWRNAAPMQSLRAHP
jgi:alpha/beta superfamily hydrolase